VAFAPDGKTVVTAANDDGTVRRWRAADGKLLAAGPGPDGLAYVVELSPDGKVAASGRADGTVLLWEASTGKPRHTLRGHGDRVGAVAFSPDGSAVATGGWDDQVRLWDTATGRPLRTLRGRGPALALAFSPDGKTVAAGGREDEEGTVYLWEVSSGLLRLTLRGHEGMVSALAFAPDGTTVVTGGWDGAVRVWDAATGRPVRTLLEAHEGSVRVVAFSPDGRLLAAARCDTGLIHLWDLQSRDALPPLAGHQDEVLGIAFSADGRALASVSADTTGLVWGLTHGAARPSKWRPGTGAALWADLASEDAVRARRAVWALAGAPAEAVPLLRARLSPVPEARRVARLIADLADANFEDRERATRELEALGPEVGPALRKALRARPPLEPRKRLERLLERLDGKPPAAFVRRLRAVEALERAGTPEARAALERLAAGGEGLRLTEEARSTLARLRRAGRP
jgi:WD40 repeat protein